MLLLFLKSNVNQKLKFIFGLVFLVGVIWIVPIMYIWAINILFNLGIEYNIETWAASWILSSLFSFNSKN